MAERLRLPPALGELLDVLDDSELAELAGIAFASGDPAASEICLRALRRHEDAAAFALDPAQLSLFTTAEARHVCH